MNGADKPLVWLLGEIKTPPFTSEARLEAGLLLRRLQRSENLGPPQSRPMPVIGAHCHELRDRDRNKNWRIIYRIAADAIVIVEVFNKTTRTTPQEVISTCQRRLRMYDES